MLLKEQNPHGGDIYAHPDALDFSANVNPFGMPEAVEAAIRASAADCACYPDAHCRALRRCIARLERVPEDNLLFGNGAAELIYAFAASLPKEKPALVITPTFCEYRAALDAAGVEVQTCPLSAENDFTPTDELLKMDFNRYGAVFLCTPNNPTGVCASPELLYALAKTGVRLFADTCFLDLTPAPDRYELPKLTAQHPNVTVLKSLTKSFAIPGLRLGYVISADAVLLQALSRKTQCWNVSVPAQAAGCAAADCGDWLFKTVQEIARERDRLTQALCAMGIKVYPSEANYLLLHTDADLYAKLLSRGILVRSCADYPELGDGYIRIAVRTQAENDRLLLAMKEVLS